jgi:hypothetical protein
MRHRVLPALLLAACSTAIAQPDSDYDIDFVTIAAPGNLGYNRTDPNGFVTGHGAVPYTYRIARTEVTTSQWMEFINVVSTHEWNLQLRFGPNFWGAAYDTTYTGPGFRYRLAVGLPNAAMMPVDGISWRDAAMFVNWLDNGKQPVLDSLMHGAYDVSTFGTNPDGTLTDQLTHSPGARFWIPTFDELLKSFHYDPNKLGPGQGGWWLQSNGTDTPLISGPPGLGQTSAGYNAHGDPGVEHYIPLGAYPQTLTPWSLLDASGGVSEWTEGELFDRYRIYDGAPAGPFASPQLDSAGWIGSDQPDYSIDVGLRIASAVPTPPSAGVLVLFGTILIRRRGRMPLGRRS